MNHYVFLTLMSLSLAAFAAPEPERSTIETLGAFVGEWHMDLATDAKTFGERGGPGTGSMSCRWGPMQAWVDCELDSHYAQMGRYVLKIVLYPSGRRYGAFVTNSFGGGRLYLGEWTTGNQLVYQDAWFDPGRKWDYQRTTYTFHDPDRLSFAIEVSNNGVDYLPHSRGDYLRK